MILNYPKWVDNDERVDIELEVRRKLLQFQVDGFTGRHRIYLGTHQTSMGPSVNLRMYHAWVPHIQFMSAISLYAGSSVKLGEVTIEEEKFNCPKCGHPILSHVGHEYRGENVISWRDCNYYTGGIQCHCDHYVEENK